MTASNGIDAGAMAGTSKDIQMAVIGAPHGVRGEVRVKTFTADPLALGAYGPLRDADGRTFQVEAVRPARNVVVVRFAGIDSREAAEALNGVALFIDRTALPDDTLAEEEFFHEDLIGLSAEDAAGRSYGRVAAVHDFGGGDVLELDGAAPRSVMIPFSRAAVPRIDVAGGRIVIEPVAAGLADAEDDR